MLEDAISMQITCNTFHNMLLTIFIYIRGSVISSFDILFAAFMRKTYPIHTNNTLIQIIILLRKMYVDI